MNLDTLSAATYTSKIARETETSVSYSPDTIASWNSEEKVSQAKAKGSVAGSLYYTASDSGSGSSRGSVCNAGSLSDSDKDFQIEVASAAKAAKDEVQPAGQLSLFGGRCLETSSAAAANADEPDEEFDYAFDNGTVQGVTYQRVFKPQPAPAHLITPLHQLYLGSLPEDSEEGSDLVSESDGGLIHDDDLLIEESPAASTSLDQPSAHKAANDSLVSGVATRHPNAAAAAGIDGMFELDINDDFEQASGGNSFPAKGAQRMSQCAELPVLGLQQDMSASAACAALVAQQPSSKNVVTGSPVGEWQVSSSHAQQPQFNGAQQEAGPSSQLPMPDSVPLSALSPVPILGLSQEAPAHQADLAANQQVASPMDNTAKLDLEEIDLGEAKVNVPFQVSAEGPQAADEWEEVNLARAKEMAVDAPSAAIPGDKVRYPEALNYFLSADVKAIKKTLKKAKPSHRIVSCFMRLQKSSKRLEKERTRLLCLAKMPFDDSDLMHLRLLQSVYLSFVGGPGPVGRYGPHWAPLGFQGTDPTTDLRGCGILGLLHLLLLHEHDPANAQAIFKLSTAKESEFPLAPVSLNITKWTLQMVRERKLSSAAKKQQSAVTAASDFYIGTFYTLYNHWKDKKCTMAESGFVLKEIEKRASGNAMNMVRRAGTRL